MVLTVAHITPLVALIAGISILIIPRLLNFIVAAYLIVTGIIGLNVRNVGASGLWAKLAVRAHSAV
jgi:Protein of unknown function (DUF3096)